MKNIKDCTAAELYALECEHGGPRLACNAVGWNWSGMAQRRFLRAREFCAGSKIEAEGGFEYEVLRLVQKQRGAGNTVVAMADEVDCSPKRVKDALIALRAAGYDIEWVDEAESTVSMPKAVAIDRPRHIKLGWRQHQLRIGVLSDTHSGSLYCDEDVLEDIYDRFVEEGVTQVLHGGDLTTGPGMRGYPGHLHEVEPECQGPDGLVKYVAEHYPYRPTIETKFRLGNHDDWEWKRTGRCIGTLIADRREDLTCLGRGQVDCFVGPDDQTRIRLWHPSGGKAYALSYRSQKNIESMLGGTKAHLLIVGHFHVAGWFPMRNVHALLAACTEWQTPYMNDKSLVPEVGGYIVDMTLDDDGWIREFAPRFMYYYYPPGKVKK